MMKKTKMKMKRKKRYKNTLPYGGESTACSLTGDTLASLHRRERERKRERVVYPKP